VTVPVLSIEGLTIGFPGGSAPAVSGLDFHIAAGERLAIVGESGSGKSATAMSLLGLLPRGSQVTAQHMTFMGQRFDPSRPDSLEALRGRSIGMVFQEPMTSLNPVLTVGRQLTEGLVALGQPIAAAQRRATEMLSRVGIAEPERRMRQYPHEFSGGMRQRVMIAMAMLLEPNLLIADEPTTALDVTVQAQVLELMMRMTEQAGASLLLITHDMGVVAETADRVLVMQHGRLVEEQPVRELFAAPRAVYTQQLLAAVPRAEATGVTQSRERPVLVLDAVSKRFAGSSAPAVDQVSLQIGRGETLALVGESGSGKSTLGRIAARLVAADSGRIAFDGSDITTAAGMRLSRARRGLQMVFQDPYASLDPRRTIAQSIGEPLAVVGTSGADRRKKVAALLDRVGLPGDWDRRYPHQLSGGQRQRVVIARALASDPILLIADEPTSALDVSVQAEILKLLGELRTERNMAMLFITHDLAVVREVAHSVAVMRHGRILESGSSATIMSAPRHPYTLALLSAAPLPDPAQRDRSRLPTPDDQGPRPLQQVSDEHWVAL
jgi:ABC-type glutathione transport system ATPase component